jgi:hypothetical protein
MRYEVARPVETAPVPTPPEASPSHPEDDSPDPEVGGTPAELGPEPEAAGAPSATEPTPAGLVVPEDAPFRVPLDTQTTAEQRVSERIANASPGGCRAELKRRKLPVAHVGGNVKGVATPVRLTGELRGVRFVAPGKTSVYGMLDCRLAIVLDELAGVLAEHGVTAVHVDNFYRPRAHLPGSRKRSQHAYGLAIDIYGFTLSDGTTLVVERDFHGAIGTATCGPEATIGADGDANSVTLRNLVCVIARTRLFNYLLTPDYDAAHRNHLHADIGRGGTGHVLR